jgi:hypothetical protein
LGCLLAACGTGPISSGTGGGVAVAGGEGGGTAGGAAGGASGGGVANGGGNGGGEAADSGHSDGGPPDAGTPCDANGIPGSCIDVAECYGSRMPTAGLCPGPANIQCCTPRYTNACDPNLVVQPNIGLTEEPSDGGCLAGMRRVDTFCVDTFEGSLLEVLDGGATRPWSPFFPPGATRVRAVSLRGAVPQGYISGAEAGAACAEAGKRLCTDAEWLRACGGPQALTYPYGATRMNGVCNDARAVHPAVELYGTSDAWIFSHLDSPCLNQLPSSLDKTGQRTGCITAEGLFDMMGNLHEWTADPAGTFRGGFYVDTTLNGPGCDYATTAHAFTYWDYSTGFRCCAD